MRYGRQDAGSFQQQALRAHRDVLGSHCGAAPPALGVFMRWICFPLTLQCTEISLTWLKIPPFSHVVKNSTFLCGIWLEMEPSLEVLPWPSLGREHCSRAGPQREQGLWQGAGAVPGSRSGLVTGTEGHCHSPALASQVRCWQHDEKEENAKRIRTVGNQTSTKVSNLRGNALYHLAVRAYNTAGTGPSSAAVNVTTKKPRECRQGCPARVQPLLPSLISKLS